MVQRINYMWLSFNYGVLSVLLLLYLNGFNHILYSILTEKPVSNSESLKKNGAILILFRLKMALVSLLHYWRIVFFFIPFWLLCPYSVKE